MTHPVQPFYKDKDGIVRFKGNAIVAFLLNRSRCNMNELASMSFSQEDREQFAQLIGYSLCAYHVLRHVSDASALAASEEARKQYPEAGGCRNSGCKIHCGVDQE